MTVELSSRLSFRTPSSSQLLTRILEAPDLPARIEALSPPALAKLIDHVGLEDAGEIVALATTEQLVRVFDEDLWRSERPGDDERFDARRFTVWLAIMLEAGDAFVAQRLSELPEELVVLAIHEHVLVLPLDDLRAEMEASDEDEANRLDKALSGCLQEEIGELLLFSRRHDGWDDVIAAILALDRDHHDLAVRILERCAAMSTEHIEDNGGLYEVLTSEEMLEADVAADREERRAEDGHVAPSDAKAFLALARRDAETPVTEHDPVTRAWLRGLARRPAAPPPRAVRRPEARGLLVAYVLEGDDAAADAAGAPQLLPQGVACRSLAIVDAMRLLAELDPKAFAARSEEIAYLANVLAAGCSIARRRVRPVEALHAAMAVCNLGLELTAKPPLETLRTHPADGLFRIAWKELHAGRGARRSDAVTDLADLPLGLLPSE